MSCSSHLLNTDNTCRVLLTDFFFLQILAYRGDHFLLSSSTICFLTFLAIPWLNHVLEDNDKDSQVNTQTSPVQHCCPNCKILRTERLSGTVVTVVILPLTLSLLRAMYETFELLCYIPRDENLDCVGWWLIDIAYYHGLRLIWRTRGYDGEADRDFPRVSST